MTPQETALAGGVELLAGILLLLWGVELATGRLGLRDRLLDRARRWYGTGRAGSATAPARRAWLWAAGSVGVVVGLVLVALGLKGLSALM